MPIFRDSDHLREVFEPFFQRLADDETISGSLSRAGIVLRFRYTEPNDQVTIDLRQPPLSWTFGETSLEPDLEMIQSADTAHTFWLGRLRITRALATRQVVSRGPVARALKLLPALRPAYAVYADVLRDNGHEALLPAEPPSDPLGRLRGVVERALAAGRQALAGVGARGASFDPATLEPHPVPLVDVAPEPPPRPVRASYPDAPAALAREMASRMLHIRAFEELLSRAWASGDVPTEAIHLSIGQEACAVGVCAALRPGDTIATTHRGHGHMLAMGAELDGMMAEMLGRATGLCGGKGGSMHVTDAAVGALGANGIVGASGLIAAGAAHAAVLRDTGDVAVAFLGDGATNQGMFHEAANFAAVLDLPVVFVVENNLYGEFTPLARHARVDQLATRAAAYGMTGQTVDGNDVEAVRQATRAADERARAGEGPTLLECMTYRWHGHMEGESVDYRPPEEIAAWKERCPILRYREATVAQGLLDADTWQSLSDGAHQHVEAAYETAVAAPEPSAEVLHTDVFAPDLRALYTPTGSPPADERELTCSGALFEALAGELERDPRVYVLGEDVTTGGYFAVTKGLSDRFGTDRIVDTPISEYAIVGSAVGAAMAGCRPVAELLFSDFLTTAMDPIVNQAAKLRYMSGGQYSLPLVIRTPGGAGVGMAAQHSQSLEALLTGIPGLLVVAPATPADAGGLLRAAIRSDNPVLFFENKLQYAAVGPVPAGEYLVPLGVADIKRRGRDVTVVSVGAALGKALDAATDLASEGIEAEIVDVRTLVPLDLATIARSVCRTGRLVTVEDGPLGHGFGSEVVARVVEVAWRALRAAPVRVAALDIPIPYNSALENRALPDADRVADAIRRVLGRTP